jgi:type I restriction enzyme S subunit
MSALPNNWETRLISQVFYTIKEKGIESSVPYLEIGDINIENKTYELTQKPSVKGCLLARKGDVLISRVRPTRGAIVQVKEDLLNVSSAFTILRNEDTDLNHYLWLFLAWNTEYLNYLGENCTGTMYPTVSADITTNYKIRLMALNCGQPSRAETVPSMACMPG